jgi:hypothetical protein
VKAPTTPFDADALCAEARARTGLEDFGDDHFREPLRRLLRSLADEARLSPAGVTSQRERVLGSLVTRLSAEALIARHAEILDEEIRAPLVIVGPTRSGTTRLHRLLAVDPRHFAVLWWENRSPVPDPRSDWRREDPRIREARDEVRAVLTAAPELESIHPWDPEGPDEDALLCEHAFLSYVPESSVHVPSYRDWMQDQDLTPAYEFLARMLRILQWQKKQRGERGERWVLKTPQHLGFLPALCTVFPDARILQTHRDPLDAVPSAASMYSTLWRLSCDEVDPTVVGRQVRDRLELDLERCRAFRAGEPAERFQDIWFDDMQRDALFQLERIYAWLGTPFLAETRRGLEAWLVENAREKRPPHRYTLEEFGLDEQDLRSRFADYRTRFILARRG